MGSKIPIVINTRLEHKDVHALDAVASALMTTCINTFRSLLEIICYKMINLHE